MARRKMLLALGVLALGVGLGLMASRVSAAPACGHRACSDEVAQSGLTGKARAGCFRFVVGECTSGACDCGGSNTVLGTCACSPSGAFLDN